MAVVSHFVIIKWTLADPAVRSAIKLTPIYPVSILCKVEFLINLLDVFFKFFSEDLSKILILTFSLYRWLALVRLPLRGLPLRSLAKGLTKGLHYLSPSHTIKSSLSSFDDSLKLSSRLLVWLFPWTLYSIPTIPSILYRLVKPLNVQRFISRVFRSSSYNF